MKYHTPDLYWSSFSGSETFDGFLENYMVKGAFHKKVPEDVKAAFTTIENLIAHSYYFSPIYDEAYSKLLRTIEMAVKLRCVELSIEIDELKTENGKTKKKPVSFNKLIDQVSKMERGKNMMDTLHWKQRLRNISEHPRANTFVGGMTKRILISGVNIINILFTEQSYFQLATKKYFEIKGRLKRFKNSTMLLDAEQNYYLIHSIDIIDYFHKDVEIACLFLLAVTNSNGDQVSPGPIVLYATDLIIEKDFISGMDLKNNKAFYIRIDTHPENINEIETYKKKITHVPEGGFNFYQGRVYVQRGKAISEFQYNYYHSLY